MTQNIIKKYNLGIDEEKDHFLNFLNKKVRNNRKKLDQIDELSKKDRTTLKPEQIEKINSKPEVKENMKYIDNIRLMYYEALKIARDEGKFVPPSATEATTTTQKEEPTKIAAQKEEAAPVRPEVSEIERQEEIARITRENLSRVLNLVHFAQFFRDQSKAQEFKQVTDADIVYDLYAKIFTFSESDKFVKISDKINGAVNELVSYINQVDQPALRNKSYKHIQGVVENVANSTQFRNHKADVAVVQTRVPIESSAIGSIGSELKKGHEQPEKLEVPVEAERLVSKVTVQQEKLRSPEKERVVEQQPSATEEEARKDWGNVEDEEEEEEEEEEPEEEEAEEIQGEEQAPEEEQKKNPDDEWSTVKAKGKEKKVEQDTRGGNRPYRGGRGGQRGGYRGGNREGGERREGETGGYRGNREGGYRPRRQEGEGREEGKEGEQQQRGERGGYRGGRGQGRGQGRGGYRGGNREGGYQGNREGGFQRGGPRNEYVPKQQEGERKEAPTA